MPELTTPFARDFVAALSQKVKSIAPKYFYDAAGSALFDAICELPEYYPTRTETAILQNCAQHIAALAGPGARLVEFGAGSLRKIRLLIDAMPDLAQYVPIDISGEHLAGAMQALTQAYPQLSVQAVVADYSQDLTLPAWPVASAQGKTIGFFPGSTLGNFTPDEALDFLRRAARLLRGGALVLGVDWVKEPALLHAAYNDAQGVTDAFNRNLLARANRELGADFEVSRFMHSAFYNAALQRIEMHLVSRQRQQVSLCGQRFVFEEGETLHTENSYKFTPHSLAALAQNAGFTLGPLWVDDHRRFGVQWLHAPL